MWLTNGNANSESCSHETPRGRSTNFRSTMNQLWSPLQDTAQSSHVVNAPESTACKRDVPLLDPVNLTSYLVSPLTVRLIKTQNDIYNIVILSVVSQSSAGAFRNLPGLNWPALSALQSDVNGECFSWLWCGIAQLTKLKRFKIENKLELLTNCNLARCKTCDTVFISYTTPHCVQKYGRHKWENAMTILTG